MLRIGPYPHFDYNLGLLFAWLLTSGDRIVPNDFIEIAFGAVLLMIFICKEID